jgi:hypothetical protein
MTSIVVIITSPAASGGKSPTNARDSLWQGCHFKIPNFQNDWSARPQSHYANEERLPHSAFFPWIQVAGPVPQIDAVKMDQLDALQKFVALLNSCRGEVLVTEIKAKAHVGNRTDCRRITFCPYRIIIVFYKKANVPASQPLGTPLQPICGTHSYGNMYYTRAPSKAGFQFFW